MQESIYLDEVTHRNPIPAACRIGNMLATGTISGMDTTTGNAADSLEAQCRSMFERVREVMATAGMNCGDILRMTVWLKDPSDRGALNAEWLRMFPDPRQRPARMVVPYLGNAALLVQCDVLAVKQAVDSATRDNP